jgi:hypothetical protein
VIRRTNLRQGGIKRFLLEFVSNTSRPFNPVAVHRVDIFVSTLQSRYEVPYGLGFLHHSNTVLQVLMQSLLMFLATLRLSASPLP